MHIAEVLQRNTSQTVRVIRTKHAVTFLFDYPLRHVQIVLRYVVCWVVLCGNVCIVDVWGGLCLLVQTV